MNIKFKLFERGSIFVLGFFSLISLLSVSCGYTPQNVDLPKSPPLSNTSNISQNSKPVMVVQKFMELVSENKLEEANNLITTTEVPEIKGKSQEAPVKLNWAEVFKERNFSLDKIVDDKILEKNAEVKTIVKDDNNPRIKIGANFSLKNINEQWLIYDIDLITGKPDN